MGEGMLHKKSISPVNPLFMTFIDSEESATTENGVRHSARQ
jgi:hypothetical protein